ncbi:MAG: AAA family ATPase, partial [Gammaproteobacteria bacterium]|nr:AAA family ATPase [Gammaproteobacteria bacterium]
SRPTQRYPKRRKPSRGFSYLFNQIRQLGFYGQERISDLRAINALPATAELTFLPTLTVVYGGNGVGKSGFTRILSNVCFSRTQHPILPNVYDKRSEGEPAACFTIADSTGKETSFVFDGATENADLKRIAVFDTAVARTHLVGQSPLGFKPTGFDVFPEMARVYDQISNRLSTEIGRRSRDNTLTNSFVAPESSISKFVASLNANTDMAELNRLAVFGEAETARLEEVQRQINELQSNSVAEATKQLKNAKRDVGALKRRLTESTTLLAEKNRDGYRAQLATYVERTRVVAEQGAESFKQEFFRGIGTQEWEDFLTEARKLAHVEHEDYPRNDDHCLLCHRSLDEASVALIRRFWNFLDSRARREAEEASARLNKSASALRNLHLDFFSVDTTVRAHLVRLNPALANKIEILIAAMNRDRIAIVDVLENKAGNIAPESFDDINVSLSDLIAQIDSDVTRLQEQEVEDALKALEMERITLRHRQVLKQLLPEAQKYVSDLAWVKRASDTRRRSLNPHPLTIKEKKLFATVIASDYRERFSEECKSLDCDLPVEFHTQGDHGQTLRSLSIKGGHSPEKILSEGEQRAVALADFLTEIALNPANAGIVLDDPVNSQDHQRKECIAHRLITEAKNRQVVVFTHDLVFLTMLAGASKDENVEMLTHWIQRDGVGRPGQISLDDSPATTPQYRNTEKATNTLVEAKAAVGSVRTNLIQRGMGELRRTVEEIVPHHLLKQVVNRWSDRIIVTGLKKINWDDNLVADIVSAYEALSAYIEGHSHTEERSGAPPEPSQLEGMIARVDDLISRARRGRSK